MPWEKPPCSDIPVPVQSGGEPGCSVWASGISGASICWPQTPSLHQVQVSRVARYVPWAHGHREATQEYPSHTLFPAPGWPYLSAEEDECSHTACGACGGCPLTPCMIPNTTMLLVPVDGRKFWSRAQRLVEPFPKSSEQEPVLTQLLAVGICCWCRNNPSHDSGAASVRCS